MLAWGLMIFKLLAMAASKQSAKWRSLRRAPAGAVAAPGAPDLPTTAPPPPMPPVLLVNRRRLLRNVCFILAAQLLVMAVVGTVLHCLLHSYPTSFRGDGALLVEIPLLVSALATSAMLRLCYGKFTEILMSAMNTLLAAVFVALSAGPLNRRRVVTVWGVSAAAMAVLTAYTACAPASLRCLHRHRRVRWFWAVLLFVYESFLLVQTFLLPCWEVPATVHGCLAAVTFSGLFVFDVDDILTGEEDSEACVVAATNVYMDVVNILVGGLSFGGTVAGCDWLWPVRRG